MLKKASHKSALYLCNESNDVGLISLCSQNDGTLYFVLNILTFNFNFI